MIVILKRLRLQLKPGGVAVTFRAPKAQIRGLILGLGKVYPVLEIQDNLIQFACFYSIFYVHNIM
jgi:hypothetical protein